jgi:hypothetical protein
MKLFNLEKPQISFSETKLRFKIIAILATLAILMATALQCSGQSPPFDIDKADIILTRSDIIAEVKWMIDHYDIDQNDLDIDCPILQSPKYGVGEYEVIEQYGEFKGHYLTLLKALDIYDLNQYIYRGNVGRIKEYLPVQLEAGDRIKFLFIKTDEQ